MAVGRKKTLFYIIIVMLLIMVLILFLGNTSKHGFYSDVFDNEPDVDDWIKIGDESVDFIIKPQNQNFAGVVVYVKTEGKKTINADVYTEGSIYENICVDTNKSFTEGWVVLNLNRVYNEGEEYKVFIYGEKGEDIYVATGVKSEDLGNINNIIIGYGCKKQTFLFEEKMVMLLLGIVGLVYLGSELVENNSIKKKMRLLAFGMLFESVLVLSYLFNSFNENNRETFNNFQKDSDGLVICAIEEDGELEKSGYGLGYYTLDDNGEIIVEPYVSQYGLQGKVFSLLNALVSTDKSIRIARLICVVLTAMVMTVLIYLIYKRYDLLYAGCFGVVFLFSPWIINFAKSIYWVEYTWFTPMVVGLLASLLEKKRWNICWLCIGSFITILIKSLCGYEYITTVMLGMIAFLLIDFLLAIKMTQYKEAIYLLKIIVLLGLCAVLGFLCAIVIHANLRGGGNLINGVAEIWKQDVMRRTSGGTLNDFEIKYWESINASVWDVIKQYFHFPTEVIIGITPNGFSILYLTPLFIFVKRYMQKRQNYSNVFAYFVFAMVSLSWIILAKSHSYIHTHMNYILWYFGFVQTCLYVIIDEIIISLGRNQINMK